MSATQSLPELASVPWRARVDERRLRHLERMWTAAMLAHAVPCLLGAAGLVALSPVTAPLAVIALAYAWIVPELYAARGAKVLRARHREGARGEAVALGLLADLAGHRAIEPLSRTGFVLERGGFGIWALGEAGAVLVRPGGRRADCYCVKATDATLPHGDRIAHLLLALREDEAGFVTVANLAFSGGCWRLARRLPPRPREALREAQTQARTLPRAVRTAHAD